MSSRNDSAAPPARVDARLALGALLGALNAAGELWLASNCEAIHTH